MKKMSSRRRFLRQAVGSSLAMSLPLGSMSALAQNAGDYRALVCLYLYGGNDADNMIVPLTGPAHADYTIERTGVLDTSQSAWELGDAHHSGYGQTITWGVHNAMPKLAGLWAQGKVAAVANVGTLVEPVNQDTYRSGSALRPMRLFSHSDQQAQSQNASPRMHASSGWGGRIADRLASYNHYNSSALFPTAASFSGNPVMVAGEQSQAATLSANYRLSLLGTYSTVASRNAAMEALLARDTGQGLLTRANHRLLDTLELGRQVEAARQSADPLAVPFPNTGIGSQLRNVAELVSLSGELGTQRQVFFVSLGGFDTHSGQAAPQARLLGNVDDALGAFYEQLALFGMESAVTTFTMSDFGRTFQVNGNVGTDHAWGGHHFVVGGAVNSGFYGDFPVLKRNGPDSTDQRGRWIPTTGLDQYGATLAQWLGVQPQDLSLVFPNLPNFSSHNLGFMSV